MTRRASRVPGPSKGGGSSESGPLGRHRPITGKVSTLRPRGDRAIRLPLLPLGWAVSPVLPSPLLGSGGHQNRHVFFDAEWHELVQTIRFLPAWRVVPDVGAGMGSGS